MLTQLHRVLYRCPGHYVYGSATQSTGTGTGSLASRNTSQSPLSAQQAGFPRPELYSLSVCQ
ncbi:TPA: hypothetical protein ACHXBG_004006 [Escherichia coli]